MLSFKHQAFSLHYFKREMKELHVLQRLEGSIIRIASAAYYFSMVKMIL
jgi:hypothetical protein